jgi:hypothetical protein
MQARHLIAPCWALVTALAARTASAQTSDSVAFHRGQFGADFLIGGGFAAAGALHFTSSTRALLLDVNATYRHASEHLGSTAVTGNSADAGVRLGTRAYHWLDHHLYRWTTLGVSVSYNWQTSTQDTISQTTQGIGGGVFANIGATWLVTPHLGIGAQWEADLTYNHSSGSASSGTPTADFVSLSLARIALVGQLYF